MYLYQYDIHIIVSCGNVLYDNHLHYVQCGGWICTVSVKTGHCALCSCELNEWQVASMHSSPVVWLNKPRPVIRTSYRYDVHIGEKGSCTRWLSFETMVKPSFFFYYTTFLYTMFLHIRHSHCNFSLFSHTNDTISYEMWMPRPNIYCLFMLGKGKNYQL